MYVRVGSALAAATLLTGIAAAPAHADPTPTDTATASPTGDPTASQTPTETAAADPTPTPTPAETPTETPTTPAETPTETPSETPTETPPTTETPTTTPTTDTPTPVAPDLFVVLSIAQPGVKAGDVVDGTLHVYAAKAKAKNAKLTLAADQGVTLDPTCTKSGSACGLGDVNAKGDFIPVKLTIPAAAPAGAIRITTTVTATAATTKSVVHLLTVTAPGTPTPTSTTPTVVPTIPNAVTPQSVNPSAPGSVPTTPGNVLPSIDANSQTPVTANQPLAVQNVAALRPADGSPNLSNLATIQAAWLAALFALFGFLFYQARKPLRPTSAHRRTPKGQFGR